MSKAPGGRGTAGWLAIPIFLLALLPRVWGFDWQLPEALYYDELKYVLWAEQQAGDDPEEPDFRNPSLFRRLLAAEYVLLAPFEPRGSAPAERQAALGFRLGAARVTSAMLGAGAVALLYLAGASLWGPWAGLAGAALYGAAFLPVHLSHLALNDVPASLFLGAALWCAARALKRPRLAWLAAAGFAAGLAAATKYNFAVVLAAPLAACAAWRVESREWRVRTPHSLLSTLYSLLSTLAAAGLGFLVGMPEVLFSTSEVVAGFLRQVEIGNRRWPGQEPDPLPLLYARTMLQGIGLPALALAPLGAAVLVIRRPLAAAALLAPPLLYLAGMLGKPLFFARFALPLVPFVCLLAGYGLVVVARICPWPRARAPLAAALLFGAIVPSAVLDLRHADLLAEVDTRLLAQAWLRQQAAAGTRMAAQLYSLPIPVEGYPRADELRVTQFDAFAEASVARRFICGDYRYLLLSSYRYERQRTTSRRGEASTGYELLEREARLVQTFTAGHAGEHVPLHVDDTALPFWGVWQRERPGPTIKIYELPGAGPGCPGR